MSTATDTIEVTINGTTRRVDAGQTVTALLRSLDLDPRLVVVEHNREILKRDRLGEIPVRAGDTFEIVHFVGGG